MHLFFFDVLQLLPTRPPSVPLFPTVSIIARSYTQRPPTSLIIEVGCRLNATAVTTSFWYILQPLSQQASSISIYSSKSPSTIVVDNSIFKSEGKSESIPNVFLVSAENHIFCETRLTSRGKYATQKYGSLYVFVKRSI
jgi:hypothetical protein